LHREVEALGIDPRMVMVFTALERLREHGLVEDVEREPRKRGKLRVRQT